MTLYLQISRGLDWFMNSTIGGQARDTVFPAGVALLSGHRYHHMETSYIHLLPLPLWEEPGRLACCIVVKQVCVVLTCITRRACVLFAHIAPHACCSRISHWACTWERPLLALCHAVHLLVLINFFHSHNLHDRRPCQQSQHNYSRTIRQQLLCSSISLVAMYMQGHTGSHTRTHTWSSWSEMGAQPQGTTSIKNTITSKVAARHSSQIANFLIVTEIFAKFPSVRETHTLSHIHTHTHTHTHSHTYSVLHKRVKYCCRWARRRRISTAIASETFWRLFNKII